MLGSIRRTGLLGMELANLRGERVEASPNISGATCPQCNSSVISKCGEIKVWHFAHVSQQDCDSWTKPETIWHRRWKLRFPKDCREVIIGDHRADIKSRGMVIEVQNSPISPEEIREREHHYGEMIWIINGAEFYDRFELNEKEWGYTFRWKMARKSWLSASRPIYIHFLRAWDDDIGEFFFKESLFRVSKISIDGGRCFGYGKFVEIPRFVERYGGTYQHFYENTLDI